MPKTEMTKIFKKIYNVVTVVVLAFVVCLMIFTVISVTTFDKEDRGFFGLKFFIVLSDSMKDTFKAGDVVIVKSTDTDSLKAGDIITFKSTALNNYGEIVTHKIREVTVYEGEKAFITYGTTTNSDDDYPALASRVIGKYSFKLPGAGKFFDFLKSPTGYVVLILLPFVYLIVTQVVNCLKLVKKYKKEQGEIITAEKAALENDREETRRLKEELERLKNELTKTENNVANANVENKEAARQQDDGKD